MTGRELKRERIRRRLERQFDQLARNIPALQRPLALLQARGWWIIRLPIAVILLLGGVLSFLPILGLWMLPAGLLLLAIDLPMLRGLVTAALIRGRRRFNIWWRRRPR